MYHKVWRYVKNWRMSGGRQGAQVSRLRVLELDYLKELIHWLRVKQYPARLAQILKYSYTRL